MLIVLTGKTASGKDTISLRLLAKYPSLKRVITTTSRAPRDQEVNNVDYHFLTKDEFENKIKLGEFAEYVTYGGNLYGTYKKELEQALNSDVLWRIDPLRAGKVRELIKNPAIVIYITCDDEIILQRLKKRGLTDEEIQKRMADDQRIWKQCKDSYDFIVENVPDKLSETINEISQIINSRKNPT